jgi:hypothetical protein
VGKAGTSGACTGNASTASNAALLQGKDTTALWNAKTLQTLDTTAIKSRSLPVGGKAADASGADSADVGVVSRSCTGNAATASNAALLQGRDSTDYDNAKLLQGKDTTAVKTFVLTGKSATSGTADSAGGAARLGGATSAAVLAEIDSSVKRTPLPQPSTWARSQQGTDLTWTSAAIAVRCTLKNLVPTGGNVYLGAIGAATDTFSVYEIHYVTGDSISATGGTNSAQMAYAVGTDSNATGAASLIGNEVTLIASGAVNVSIRGANQFSTYVEYGSDLYGTNKCTPKVYAGASKVWFNWGGTPNAEGKQVLKLLGVKVYARWAGLGVMP